MASYVLLDMVASEYKMRLSSKVIIVDGVRLVPLKEVAKFFVSTERIAIDKETQHKRMMDIQKQENIDSEYIDRKGQV